MRLNCIGIIIIVSNFICSCADSRKENTSENLTDFTMSQMISDLMMIQFESEGCPLNFQIDSLDSEMFFMQIEKLPKLVFFHSELNCNSCVEESISDFNDFNEIIGNENIVFLASYRKKRDLTIFKRTNRINYPTYNVSSVGLPIEKTGLPFCFIFNENHKAECVFIPMKEIDQYFKLYLSTIKNKYFQQEK